MNTPALSHQKMLAMNQALVLGAVRQHELAEAAEKSNARLHAEITERRHAEAKLRASEIRYRRLFEAAHDGVLLLDPGTRKITDANPFMTKLLGYPRSQLVGKELFEIGLLKDASASQKMVRKLKRKHEVRYEDLPLKSKRGRHQEVEVVANLYQEDGTPVIQCNIRDITQRKAAEEALRASEERYRTLFDLGPVGIYVSDVSGVIQRFNQRAAALWGRKPAAGDTDAQFSSSSRIFRRDGSIMPYAQEPMAGVLRGRTPEVRNAEVVLKRADASRITVVMNICPLRDQHGKITGAINCFYDITERKRAEEAQRRLAVLAASNWKLEQEIIRRQAVQESLRKNQKHQQHLLEQSHRMAEQLRHLSRQILYAQEEERKRISRELHDVVAQTLTGINVRLAMLKRDAAVNTKGLDRSIARTQRMVEHSVRIVHQFARELRPAVLDDLGLIPALHSSLKYFMEQAGVRARLTAFAGVETLSVARRTMLYRVAQEALNNVSRHGHASHVHVSIQKVGRAIRMQIIDNGKGFHPARLSRGQRSKRLGLLGMRERVEMVGGTFSLESAPGCGTTVQVDVPLAGGPKLPGRKPSARFQQFP